MAYNSVFGLIPGYDELAKYKAKKKRQADWYKNVGSKGRRIAYEDRNLDFGSTSEAFKAIAGQTASYLGSAYLPFGAVKKFKKRGKKSRRSYRR